MSEQTGLIFSVYSILITNLPVELFNHIFMWDVMQTEDWQRGAMANFLLSPRKQYKTTTSWPGVAVTTSGSRDHRFMVKPPPPSSMQTVPLLTCPSLVASDLHPQLFRLITPNVILIKNCGVKGFSLPEKRVQIVAQWQTPSLAWEEMHPDIARVVPNDQSQIKQKRLAGPFEYHGITFFLKWSEIFVWSLTLLHLGMSGDLI